MKKIFYYSLVPTKAEEEAAKASNILFQGSRSLVEIRDLYPPPPSDANNPWQIRKRVTTTDVVSGRLMLSYSETFDHIFRYWNLDMANYVLMGHKAPVVVWDVTEEGSPVRYRNESIFFERGSSDEFYFLGWLDLVRSRLVNPGDEVGLYWERRNGAFQFKLLCREV